MTVQQLQEFISRTPALGRVAFTLAIAEKALTLMPEAARGHAVAKEAMQAAWQLAEGSRVPALDLSEHLERIIDIEIDADGSEQTALGIAGTAIAYATWEALRMDLASGAIHRAAELPSDLSDISVKEVEIVYARARTALGETLEHFGDTVMDRISQQVAGNPANIPGPGISQRVASDS
jgi:hypothetical protein